MEIQASTITVCFVPCLLILGPFFEMEMVFLLTLFCDLDIGMMCEFLSRVDSIEFVGAQF